MFLISHTSKFTICTVVVLFGIIVMPKESYGQFTVNDVGPNASRTALQSTLSAANDVITSGGITTLVAKETALDPIAYAITRKIIQSMVRSTITWINSGFQGSPAFITDLKGFLTGVADEVVGDFIYGSDLAFLCSPFQLDIKIALATQYNQSRSGYQPQCTLSDVTDNIEGFINGSFSEGGWPAWFELTQGSTNDPNKAYFEAEIALQAAIRDAQGNVVRELDWGNGFLPVKICSDTQAASGSETNCTVTTPGTVIEERLNSALGLGEQSLITADEINEVLGALLSQLAQQAVTGVYGLLGMGGNSSYTDYSYGADGTSSYLDALEAENNLLNGSSSPLFAQNLINQIKRENDFLDIQYEIVARTTAAEQNYASSKAAASNMSPACNLSSFPNNIKKWRTDGNIAIASSNIVVPVLDELNFRLQNATNPSVQNDILTEYSKLEQSGSLTTETELVQADLTLEYQVQTEIENFESKIASELNSCRNDDD